MGLLLAVVVHAASIQSWPHATTRGSGRRQAGVGQTVGSVSQIAGDLGRCRLRGPTGGLGLRHGRLAADRGARKPDRHRFEVLPGRWVVERMLAWLSRCRRISKEYEERTDSSEAWVHIAMVHLMLKRLHPALTYLSHTL